MMLISTLPRMNKTAMTSTFRITLYLLLLISLGYFATDIYLPSLPALAAYFHASDNEVQMTLFSYLLSFSLTPIIFGPLSDHFGRKKIIIFGILVSIAATAACLLSPTIQWLIVARFVQGFGTGAVIISSRAVTIDLFTGKALAKQMSITTMCMPLVLATAPTIGGVLQEMFQWQAVFIYLLCHLFVILIMVIFTPETLKHPSQKNITQIFSAYRCHLNNRLFLINGINFILPSLGLFAYLTVSPFLFQEVLGLSPVEYGSLALYTGAVILITGYVNLKLIHYFSVFQLLSLGASLIVLSGCLLLLFHMLGIFTIWSLLVPALIYFTCMPLCIANGGSKTMSLVQGHFGAASALLTTSQFLFGAAGSLIFSFVHSETLLPLGICFLCVGLLSLINLRYVYKLESCIPN